MKPIALIRFTALAGLFAILLGSQTALAKPFMYVPLGDEGKIVVIDTAQDKVVDTIDGVGNAHGLAATPNGKFLIAGSIEAREAGSGAPEKPAEVTEEDHAAHHGAAPHDSPKAAAMISTVSVVRVSDGSVIRRIDVPGAVHHVAVSPNGRFAVVTHPKEGKISAIDLNSYEVVESVATGPAPNYVVFSRDGDLVYVSNSGNNTVSAVNTGEWTVRWNFAVGASPEHVVLSGDGASLYVNNVEDGTVSVIEIGKQKVAQTIKIGARLHGIDVSDDGKTLFVTDRDGNKLVAVDLESEARHEVPLEPAPYHLAVVRGMGKLYISSAGAPKIWVVDRNSLAVSGDITIDSRTHQILLLTMDADGN